MSNLVKRYHSHMFHNNMLSNLVMHNVDELDSITSCQMFLMNPIPRPLMNGANEPNFVASWQMLLMNNVNEFYMHVL